MTGSVILGGARTPVGKMSGTLASKSAVELGGIALAESIRRSGVPRDEIEHVIMGQVLQGGAGQIPSRQAAFNAGLAETVTSETINRVCGSGLRAVTLADTLIKAEGFNVIAAGGMESMSQAPYLVRQGRGGYRMGHAQLEDMMVTDGLYCALDHVQMGSHGDRVAAEEGISRAEQDAWALRSQMRAVEAQDACRLSAEIIPVEIAGRKEITLVEKDEAPRRDTSAEALAKLKPVFDPNGSVTAGNAPGVNDGAGAMIVTSEEWAQAQGLRPMARIISHAAAAWQAPYLAFTPHLAAEKAMAKAGLTIGDIDLVEINEAFANVAIISTRRLGVPEEKVNVNGGAIALGHPLAASGARILLTLMYELDRRGGGLGIAAICSGGGQGDAIIIEVPGRSTNA
ncbi:MAG: acetyl-CoA C-acetyltransferase [Thermomicrobiales bacterium]|nr:acetyl-CoA C-acetyltransferase [Thermomicrobiales bacterium]